MPIHDMTCGKCGSKAEVYFRNSICIKVKCPKCGTEMKRVPSVPGRPVIK